MLFLTALFLATTLLKIVQTSNFLLDFHQKFSTFPKIFQPFVFIVQTREKSTQDFNIFWKIGPKNAVLQISRKNYFENFWKFAGFRGEGASHDLLLGRPAKVFPSTQNVSEFQNFFNFGIPTCVQFWYALCTHCRFRVCLWSRLRGPTVQHQNLIHFSCAFHQYANEFHIHLLLSYTLIYSLQK